MNEKIEEIKERRRKASQGKWSQNERGYSWKLCTDTTNDGTVLGEGALTLIKAPIESDEIACYPPSDQDADFIVHAPEDIDYLVAETERLEKEGKSSEEHLGLYAKEIEEMEIKIAKLQRVCDCAKEVNWGKIIEVMSTIIDDEIHTFYGKQLKELQQAIKDSK